MKILCQGCWPIMPKRSILTVTITRINSLSGFIMTTTALSIRIMGNTVRDDESGLGSSNFEFQLAFVFD